MRFRRLLAALFLLIWVAPAAAQLSLLGAGQVSGSTISPQCSQFINRISAPTPTRQGLYCALINSLVTTGVWTKLDVLYIYAAADQTTALTNLVQSSFGATAINAPTFTVDTGYTFASTKYLRTGYIPSTAAGNLTLNAASMGFWSYTVSGGASSMTDMGGADASNADQMLVQFTGNTWFPRENDFGANTISNSTTQGLLAQSRTASNLVTAYINGSSIGTVATASVAIPTKEIYVGAFNNNGTPQNYSTKQHGMGFIGGGLTAADMGNLYTAVHTYLQAVAGIP